MLLRATVWDSWAGEMKGKGGAVQTQIKNNVMIWMQLCKSIIVITFRVMKVFPLCFGTSVCYTVCVCVCACQPAHCKTETESVILVSYPGQLSWSICLDV